MPWGSNTCLILAIMRTMGSGLVYLHTNEPDQALSSVVLWGKGHTHMV